MATVMVITTCMVVLVMILDWEIFPSPAHTPMHITNLLITPPPTSTSHTAHAPCACMQALPWLPSW